MYELFPVIFFEQKSKSVKVITKKKLLEIFIYRENLCFKALKVYQKIFQKVLITYEILQTVETFNK